MITDNEELRIKLNQIIDSILKMCHLFYRRRPTCDELLSEYNKWGIDRSQIKHLNDFEEKNDLVKKSKFLDNYLKS